MPFYRCIWAWGILLALLAYGVHSLEEADGLEEIQRAIDSIHSQSKTISSLVNSLGNQDLNANQDKLSFWTIWVVASVDFALFYLTTPSTSASAKLFVMISWALIAGFLLSFGWRIYGFLAILNSFLQFANLFIPSKKYGRNNLGKTGNLVMK